MSPIDGFLEHCVGIIHVGANTGQERDDYARFNLNVLWIEAYPEAYAILLKNINGLENQISINALISDCDGREITLNIASNEGASSSIFPLKHHLDIWPDIHYVGSSKAISVTLASLVKSKNVDLGKYDGLVIDVQGAELMVLQGAVPILSTFKFIKVETSDFDAYEGGSQRPQIQKFMDYHKYHLVNYEQFDQWSGGGWYFNLVYERT